jgi:hypothetical protein
VRDIEVEGNRAVTVRGVQRVNNRVGYPTDVAAVERAIPSVYLLSKTIDGYE